MRTFDAEKGKIIRSGLESMNGNGSRSSAMERKVFNAALELLKDEDDELGKIIGAAVAAAAKKTAGQIDELRSELKSQEKDDAPTREVLDELKALQRKAKDSHRELLEFIEETGDSVAEAVGEMKLPESKARPRIKSLDPVRGADGKIKRVDVTYED